MDTVTETTKGEEYKLYLQSWEENRCKWQKSGPRDELSQIALSTPSLTSQVLHLQYFLLPPKEVQFGQ